MLCYLLYPQKIASFLYFFVSLFRKVLIFVPKPLNQHSRRPTNSRTNAKRIPLDYRQYLADKRLLPRGELSRSRCESISKFITRLLTSNVLAVLIFDAGARYRAGFEIIMRLYDSCS